MDSGAEISPGLYNLPGFQDPCSSISHLWGAVVFLILGCLLLRRGRGDRGRLIYLGVYAFSCVLLLSMSGVYHMMDRGGMPRRVMERLDHGAIFVLIAGTFTPAHGLLLRGRLRWAPLAFVWVAAITGITLKTIFFNDMAEWLGLSLYLAMGWFGAFSGALLAWHYGFTFIKPMLYGGLAYSVGGVLEYCRWPVVVPRVVHPHEIFHLAVLAGALFHFVFVWRFATGEVCLPGRAPVPAPAG
jgi:channel protein (hemolysin III family)